MRRVICAALIALATTPAIADRASAEATDRATTARYSALAERIGMDYPRVYRWQRFVDVKRANDIGAAGEYELMQCDGEPSESREYCTGFYPHETVYYSNHDVTVTWKFFRTGEDLNARILAIAEGRVPKLYDGPDVVQTSDYLRWSPLRPVGSR